MKHWINTVSHDHVQLGVKGGFTQAGHGRSTGLKRLAKGDLIVFYSPRTAYPDGEPLQAFTALGRITDDEPYQATMGPAFHPWRRRVAFVKAQPAPIHPLIDALSFTKDKKSWGYPFRRGLFEIDAADFERIAKAMKVTRRLTPSPPPRPTTSRGCSPPGAGRRRSATRR